MDAAAHGTSRSPAALDPADWSSLRAEGHRMLDDMFDHMAGLAEGPVWQPAPAEARAAFDRPLPLTPTDLATVHADFRAFVLPYGSGNAHPGFMGWVQGGGTAVGMLAEMLAAGLNSNLGGRDHMPIRVEQQIGRWMGQLFGLPDTATGLFLTGASQANFVAVLIARVRALGAAVRSGGLGSSRLVAYASREAHGCIPRAMDMAGLGADQLRSIAVDERRRIDPAALGAAIRRDRDAGLTPFLLVGTAGTVNTGAIDDLAALAAIADAFGLHFHVDGALGALGMASADLAPLFAGIERSDSLAFDFHKWGQVPYDAGFLLVRDAGLLKDSFAAEAAYLTRAATGLAGGDWWPCDYGPDLSRGFRALKVWFTIKTYGLQALGAAMAENCRLARHLAALIEAEPRLSLLAPVTLNIVCFGYRGAGEAEAHPRINARIVECLHAEGRVAPSMTLLNGRPAIRAALVNHRTTVADVTALVERVLAHGAREWAAADA